MKRKTIFPVVIAFVILLCAGCTKDNFKKPSSFITGRIVYQGQPLGIRSAQTGGVQLEIWQKGYQLYTKLAVSVAQDGTFSANLFDGNYKLIPLKGVGPWADKLDSIDVTVNGTATVDVPVDPYFIIKGESFQKSGSTINATFTLQKVNTTKALELVRIYVGQTVITDQTNNVANAQKATAAIPDITQPITLSIPIPASLANSDYLFARVGVKTLGVAELLYTQSIKIPLK